MSSKDKEAIENIAELIKSDQSGYVQLMEHDRIRIAGVIYWAGYRKLPGDGINITRQEFLKLPIEIRGQVMARQAEQFIKDNPDYKEEGMS